MTGVLERLRLLARAQRPVEPALPDVARSAEELVNAADRAMYKVKMTGKNGIHLAAD